MVTGVAAALCVGLVVVALARAVMRVVVLASGRSGHFSWPGSIGICVIVAAFMLPGTVFAVLRTERGRWLLLAPGAAVYASVLGAAVLTHALVDRLLAHAT